MNHKSLFSAEQIFNLEIGTYNINQIKSIYRKLAKDNHPDMGGSVEMMQLINTAWDDFNKYFLTNCEYVVREVTNAEGIAFINELKSMIGVTIEIIGYWIWLSGDTFTYKDSIKCLGFKFSGSKKAWYWSPTIEQKVKFRGTSSLKKIRTKYGSEIIQTSNVKRTLLSA